jgi:hypothetical protein
MLTLKVITAANSSSDEAIVRFSDDATAMEDLNIDAVKMYGDINAPQLFFPVPGNKILTVNVLPWTGKTATVPMNFSMAPYTQNEISVDGIESFKPGTEVYLEDKKEVTMTDLVATPKYQFYSTPLDDQARFILHFTKSTIGIDEMITGFQIYSFEDYLYVKNLVKGTTTGHIWIYDLTGRTVFNADLKDLSINKFDPGVVEGYYVARVVTRDGVYTQKVYLK